jgi:hypothetical protein
MRSSSGEEEFRLAIVPRSFLTAHQAEDSPPT